MTQLDAELVRRKLAMIGRNLEAAVDANLHLLRAHGGPAPTDYRASFLELGRIGVLSRELADQLAPAAGLRNRLVHQHDELDDAIVLRSVAQARAQFSRYIAAVEAHLSAQGL